MFGTTEATDQLFAAMQRGELKAKDLLPKLTKEFREFSKAGLPSATKSIGAEIERFKNSMFSLFTGMGEAGGLSVVVDSIKIVRQLIEGLSPIISKMTMMLSAGLKLITVPLKVITGALQIIKVVDEWIKNITDSLLDLVGANEGIKKLTSDIVSLSTALSVLLVAAVANKFGILARVLAMVATASGVATTAIVGQTSATIMATRATNFFTAASVRLRTVWLGIAGIGAAALAKFAAVAGIGALVAEELAAVGDTTKTGLAELAMESNSIWAKIARGPMTLVSAAGFGIRQMLDMIIGAFFGDFDQITWNFREAIKDFFNLDFIDPTLGMSELWDKFWDHSLEAVGKSGPLLSKIGTVFVFVGQVIQRSIALVIDALSGLIDGIKWTLTGGLVDAVASAGKAMMGKFKSAVVDPVIGAWNSLADKIGIDRIKIGMESDVTGQDAANDSRVRIPQMATVTRLNSDPASQLRTNGMSKVNTNNNMTLNQTINTQPGQSAEEIARMITRESQRVFSNNLTSAAANAPRTE